MLSFNPGGLKSHNVSRLEQTDYWVPSGFFAAAAAFTESMKNMAISGFILFDDELINPFHEPPIIIYYDYNHYYSPAWMVDKK